MKTLLLVAEQARGHELKPMQRDALETALRYFREAAPKHTADDDRLEIEDWCHAGFYVHYDNNQTAEVSWSFIRELPPKK